MSDFWDLIKELFGKFLESRTVVLGLLCAAMFLVLVSHLYSLQIIHGDEYQNEYITMTEKTTTTPATRGRIYDRNGNLLAYNELCNDVIIQDNGDYTTPNEKNLMIYRLVKILNKNRETVRGEFKVTINDRGKYEFTVSSKNSRNGFLRDVYGLKDISELDDDAGKYPSTITAEELVERVAKSFKINELADEEKNAINLTPLEKLQIVNIRYTMSLTSYRRYESTTIASSVSEKTKISVLEEAANLKGVDVVENTKRVYNDPIYFSSIIGYTGKVQEDQLDTLKATDDEYTLNDTVGRIGIEQYFEYELHGRKGEKHMYVDNVGRILQVIDEEEPVAGEDVYLTIDKDLQIGIYHLVERQLAGVLASKIVNEDNPNEDATDATSLRIPVKDAYYQLINNNLLDINHFSQNDASDVEKDIYSRYEKYHNQVIEQISEELSGNDPTPLNELPEDINQYMVYIYNKLCSQEVIVTSAMDQNAEYYQAWKNDTISMRDFLYTGIAENWLDSTVLNVRTKYIDADDIFMALIDYIEQSLIDDTEFAKLNYKYLIKGNVVKGRELCMALYTQGVLTDDESNNEYRLLSVNGDDYAYDFLIEKINNIEITPAQLALDPCTAGCVITDVTTGEVRAIVSYPGYDNNKLADSMDINYYNSLLKDQSLPLYNNATQAKKAPGSTFKPITAVAALEEGLISPYETVTCTGLYEEIKPNIKCWVYPGHHDSLDVVGAIENSCNYFFNEMGHRMAIDSTGEYNTEKAMNIIDKYASYFGLDHKSGVEITESEPNISTIAPEQSAMGQGNHSYTNVQLARYVSAIANKGTVYELSIVDKLTDSDGNIIKDYKPSVYNQLSFSDSTWNLVREGMHKVTSEGSARNIFSDLSFDIAGKTGTAQESKTRANHSFFVSFGPYEDPEVAVTVNIPYGYSSSNAAAVARNVYSFYFGNISLENAVNGGALSTYDVTIGGD
ncbi:MAG: penicillin-binding transpeptidase domain-containing protein [Lachnospiraceae bacterium]|nr:penicillin-binding transpeptidase domain-containing protein [Lachnospiraceae bacterium]